MAIGSRYLIVYASHFFAPPPPNLNTRARSGASAGTGLGGHLRTGDPGGVTAAVDMDEDLVFSGRDARLVIGQPLGMNQAPGDLAKTIDPVQMLRSEIRAKHAV